MHGHGHPGWCSCDLMRAWQQSVGRCGHVVKLKVARVPADAPREKKCIIVLYMSCGIAWMHGLLLMYPSLTAEFMAAASMAMHHVSTSVYTGIASLRRHRHSSIVKDMLLSALNFTLGQSMETPEQSALWRWPEGDDADACGCVARISSAICTRT